MTTPHPGRTLLADWRARHKKSQNDIARALVPSITQAAVSKWENGDEDQRPDLRRAVQLESLTAGDVPATSWGYPEHEINALRAAFVRPPGARGHTANDFAPEPAAAPGDGPHIVRDGFDQSAPGTP